MDSSCLLTHLVNNLLKTTNCETSINETTPNIITIIPSSDITPGEISIVLYSINTTNPSINTITSL